MPDPRSLTPIAAAGQTVVHPEGAIVDATVEIVAEMAPVGLDGFLMTRLANVSARERGEIPASRDDALLEIRLLAATDPELAVIAPAHPAAELHIAFGCEPDSAGGRSIAAWIDEDGDVMPLPGLAADLGRRQSSGSWRGASLAPVHVLPLAAMIQGSTDGHSALHVSAAGRRLRHVCSPRT